MSDDDDFMQDSGDEECVPLLHFELHRPELTMRSTVMISTTKAPATTMKPVILESKTNIIMPSR